MTTNDKNNSLTIACGHVLNGEEIHHQTEAHVLCEKCFNHYGGYGHDKNGYWRIPKNEDFTNLKRVCRSCIDQITKNKFG